MYCESFLQVGKAQNGFIVEAQVEVKPEKSNGKDIIHSCTERKTYLAKTKAELATLISQLMPLLDTEYKDEKAFDSAFSEATGISENEPAK